MEKITVVVPVYNMGQYLKRSVNSLLKQTYKNYEIILVDDGSTDNSGQLCDELSKLHDSIRTIHKENGGLSSARNAGMRDATGGFIIFPDPDDWVEEDYLQRLIDLHQEYQSDLEICGYYITDEKKQVTSCEEKIHTCFSMEDATERLFIGGGYSGFAWNKLYHLDIIRKNDLAFDEELGMAQDLHFAFRYFLKCKKISYDSMPVYYYFQHAGGVTNTRAGLSTRKISGLKTYEKMAEIAEKEFAEVVPMIHSTLANICLQFIYIYYDSKMCDRNLKKLLIKTAKDNSAYFWNNKNYSLLHKILWGVAFINPKLYYLFRKCMF